MRVWATLSLAWRLGPALAQLTVTSTLDASPAPAPPADGLTLTVTSVSEPAPSPTPAVTSTLTQMLVNPVPAGTDYVTRTIFSTISAAGEPPRVVTQVTVVVQSPAAPATQTVVQVSNCAATRCQDLGHVRRRDADADNRRIVPAQCLVLNDHADACWCSYARIKAQCLAVRRGARWGD